MNYRTICSSSVKNAIGVLIGITLNLHIALCSMVILTIYILLIHDHGTYFHLFVLLSISFIHISNFFEY